MTLGQVEYNSLGIESNTYENVTGDNTWKKCKIEKILDNPIKLNSKFEISSQIFENNSSENYAGRITISLYEKNENAYNLVSYICIGDCWSNIIGNFSYAAINNSRFGIDEDWRYAWSNTNPGGRYSLLGDGNKFYLYRENVLIDSIDGSLSKEYTVDKIDVSFETRIGNEYVNLPTIVEDLYVGKPLFYKSIIGE